MISQNSLVSIIIPCFNAERWIKESIDSCLAQRYQPIEIIVINDGSTDDSLKILKSYGDRITYETGPNQGGNHARNRGFLLSRGKYIQFLDADDYLLPQKLEKQVQHLEKTGADVVYGDWRHKYHYPDGSSVLDKVKISGEQNDIVASLLSGWWVSPACLLFCREAVEASTGWDESLSAGQDKDFLLSVLMSGANAVYQPGCDAIYRRYGNVTVSTSSQERYLENHIKIFEKYKNRLLSEGRLSPLYKDAIAQSFFMIARSYLHTDRAKYNHYLQKTLALSPNFKPKESERTLAYNTLRAIVGFPLIEKAIVVAKLARQKILMRSI